MERFYLVMRAHDCMEPENGDHIYNHRKDVYTIRERAEAKILCQKLALSHGGEWFVFRLELIGNASVVWSVPTT